MATVVRRQHLAIRGQILLAGAVSQILLVRRAPPEGCRGHNRAINLCVRAVLATPDSVLTTPLHAAYQTAALPPCLLLSSPTPAIPP